MSGDHEKLAEVLGDLERNRRLVVHATPDERAEMDAVELDLLRRCSMWQRLHERGYFVDLGRSRFFLEMQIAGYRWEQEFFAPLTAKENCPVSGLWWEC